MKLWTPLAKLDTAVRRLRDRVFYDARTQNFLKERNARLVVKDAKSPSFHAINLKPTTQIVAFGRDLRFEIRLLDDHTAWVSVYDNAAKRPLVGVQAPITDEAGVLNLDFADVHVKLNVDAARSSGSD